MKKTTLSQVFISRYTAVFLGNGKNENTHAFNIKTQKEKSTVQAVQHDSYPPYKANIFDFFIGQLGRHKVAYEISQRTRAMFLTSVFGVFLSFGGFAQINPGNTCSGVPPNLTVNTSCVTNIYAMTSVYTLSGITPSCAAGNGTFLYDGWYSFVATASYAIIIETGSYRRTLSVWKDCTGTTSSQLDCFYQNSTSTSTITRTVTGLNIGDTYYVQIRRRSSTGNTNLNGTICIRTDNYPCGATSLTVNSTCINTAGTTNGAAGSILGNASCANYYGQDVWYKVVVPPMGYLIFEMSNLSSTSTAMAIYGGTCSNLSEIDCNVNTATAGISNYTYIGAALTPGDTIYIRVWKTSTSGGLNLSYNICVHTPDCSSHTSNDFCEGAATLTEDSTANFGSNTNLYTNDNPGDVEVPFSCGTIQNNSWYSFVASSATATFPFSYTNAGCTSGIQAEVFEFDFTNGCCINPISKSNCESLNNTNPFTLNATGLIPGETYYLMVDGWNGAVCNFSISGWSAFGVLPIELIEFTGEAESRTNVLKWRTASEINSDEMIVQKSDDGINFKAIGSVKGAGNSTTENKYTFEDFDINQTVVYYRLKQIDFDGSFEYSNTISVIREGRTVLFPNPTKGNITLKFADPIAVDWTISFTDLYGRNITNTIEKMQASHDQLVFATEELKKGYYFVKVINGNGQEILNSSFIKE